MINGQKLKIKHIFWVLFFIIVGVLIASIALKSAGYEKIFQTPANNTEIEQNPNQTNSELASFYFIKDPNIQPTVQSEAYLVGDLDTGEIILQKNKDQKFPIASVSKLFTAIVSAEKQNQDEVTQISAQALQTEGENGELYLGQKIKVKDLIYPMLLESSNDAAEAIAEYSGRHTFIEQMNQKVQDLEMTATSFVDPSGLSEKNQSTASDLFKFTQYLKTAKPDLLQLTTNKSYNNKNQTWFNTSQFLDLAGYLGGKRGYTSPAMQTALSAFTIPLGESGNRNLGIIVLRSPDRYKDVSNIYNYLKKYIYYGKESDADLTWVKDKEGILEEVAPDFVTLLFGGDIMLDRGVKNSVIKNFGGDYSILFQNLYILKEADIAFANLEGPASDVGVDKHNLYSFRMDPSVIPVLGGAGFSVLSVANNHAGDWKREAYADTLARLKENEIQYTGGGINLQEAVQPTIIEKNGIKIGYLGFSDVGPSWMQATNADAGILLASDPNFDTIIKNASKQVDYLVVSFHWGIEYQTEHNSRQEYLAHKAIDDGAKIIIGGHPHVAQDTEVYKNSFIAYSLGNFIFDQYFSTNTMQGKLLQIKLYKNGAMTDKLDTLNLNSVFQPQKIIEGKEEKVQFETIKKLE